MQFPVICAMKPVLSRSRSIQEVPTIYSWYTALWNQWKRGVCLPGWSHSKTYAPTSESSSGLAKKFNNGFILTRLLSKEDQSAVPCLRYEASVCAKEIWHSVFQLVDSCESFFDVTTSWGGANQSPLQHETLK